MRVVRTVAELRERLAGPRREGQRIGLVPTMGALHDGHLSLIRRAHEDCGVVVVSLFVNPAQFNEQGDLDRYPRDEDRDRELAAAAGADLLFAPGADEVYPAGFATSVEVLGGVSERLEGESRGAAHFRGVATVVTKLLLMALPDAAYFGRKDAQQVAVIRRLVTDLNIPTAIEALPTVREPDGLAMSSRNALLSPAEREKALALSRALDAVCTLADRGESDAAALLAEGLEQLSGDVQVEYLALVDPVTFEPLNRLDRPALLAVAARAGQVRLIDNAELEPVHSNDQRGGTTQPCSV